MGCFGDVAWVRVEGKGNAGNSAQLKHFAEYARSKGYGTLVVDLENCPAMDSTFMGTMAAAALALVAADPPGKLEVINAVDRALETMSCLGLDCVMTIDSDGSRWREERRAVVENLAKPRSEEKHDKKSHAKVVMEAHEALVEANEENVTRFRDVLDFLHQELDGDNDS